VHKELVPPNDLTLLPDRYNTAWLTEFDILKVLTELGHEVKILGLFDNIQKLIKEINSFNPHFVFNLLEEFNQETQSDYKVLALLDMLRVKYSGCNPKGLLLARDKALSKKILKYHNIETPSFYTLPRKKKRKLPKSMTFPLIVKCLYEEASYGIAKASIVHNKAKLQERVKYIHEKLDQDAIIEEFIPGREIYVGVIGSKKLTTLPAWELSFKNVDFPENEIYSSQAKWNKAYRQRKGIDTSAAVLTKDLEEKINKVVKKAYQVLNLSGYARIDLRICEDNKVYILEANPNPNIAYDDEFARSADHQGISYPELITRLLP
jgi:D-alanine-D-alanine ligase